MPNITLDYTNINLIWTRLYLILTMDTRVSLINAKENLLPLVLSLRV